MPTVLYVWQAGFPWDVRVEKVCCSLHKAGMRVIILARWREGEPERETFKGVEIVRVGKQLPRFLSLPLSYNPVWMKAIRQAITEFEPKFIIAREIMLTESVAVIARKHNIPVIMDMAEHYPAAMRGWDYYSRNPVLRFFVHRMKVPDIIEKRSVGYSDGILTVCKEQNIRLHRSYGYPHDKMQVVHNTPNLTWFSGIARSTAYPPRIFAHHGYMTPVRNLETLTRAFIIVASVYKDVRLVFSGSGEVEETLKNLVAKAGIEDQVLFTGPFEHSELHRLYSETDIAVLPYSIDELISHTLPNKLFDYMACGKPVIVSLAPSMKRIIDETGAGIAVDCTDESILATAMMKIREMDVTAMSNNGMNAATSQYNWDNDSAAMIHFLQQFANS